MADDLTPVFEAVEKAHAAAPVATRRAIIKGAAGLAGGLAAMGVLGGVADAKSSRRHDDDDEHHRRRGDSPQTILNVAATAEVLATIVNTIGFQKVSLDAVTKRNVGAAAREELIHYNVLASIGGVPLTKTIWVPDAVFADATGLLNTLQVGDQIFVNAYLIATKRFAQLHKPDYSVIAAEFMGVEAVHRALARQSLGQLGNDRVFMKTTQPEMAPGAPNQGQPGFTRILDAAAQLQAAGFGFGAKGAMPGAFYDFDKVSATTPNDPDLNTLTPVSV
jgi:hypothetical protein